MNQPATRPLRIVHIIGDLKVGGAQMALLRLLSGLDGLAFQVEVIALQAGGAVRQMFLDQGIKVTCLDMRGGLSGPRELARLVRLLRATSPDGVATWMYHANLAGGVAARLAGRIPVIWNVRNAGLDIATTKRTTRLVSYACARLSPRLVKRSVYVSHHGRAEHVRQGYSDAHALVIPNGFDLNAFKPDAEAGRALREELEISVDHPLIGLVARFDPQKDHENFLQAARRIHVALPDVHFLLCGDGVDRDNRWLTQRVRELGIDQRCRLLGDRRDLRRVYGALDLAASSSLSEAFPNVVGEAMACEVPCVVTDVGDSAQIVGETGMVVPPRSPDELAAGCLKLLAMDGAEREALARRARARIAENYSLSRVRRRHMELWGEVFGLGKAGNSHDASRAA